MHRYYIRHKIQPGDIVHLSDLDSEWIIKNKLHKEEDAIKVQSPEAVYLAQVTFIDTASVEIEILKKLAEEIDPSTGSGLDSDKKHITIIQAASNDSKFSYFIEKATEIGVDEIIPIESSYSLITTEQAEKKKGLWTKIIDDACEQCRRPYKPVLQDAIKIEDLKRMPLLPNPLMICLATEPTQKKSLAKFTEQIKNAQNYYIAIGPEKGWNTSDIEIFKQQGFEFATMGENILRTETAGLVITSIINFLNNRY